METVSIKRCETYEGQEVQEAMFECLNNLDIKNSFKNKTRVLVKPNLIMRKNPNDCATTHPVIVESVVKYLQNLGCEVIIAESPGGPYTNSALKKIYMTTGMTDVAERTGCTLNEDTSFVEVINDKAKFFRKMKVIKPVEDIDFIVSVAKMKTHCMMTYTGAVKNLFGIIPGITKAEYHFKINNNDDFADALIDICEYKKPMLSIIDAIDGMEGDGPTAGTKKHVGLIMASQNPYVLDKVALHIMGIEEDMVPMIKKAKERNLLNTKLQDINIKGIQLNEINIEKFILPTSIKPTLLSGNLPKWLENFIENNFKSKPIFNHNLCISCGECARSCPAKVIEMKNKKPTVSYKNCISCFCCQELCPKKAVTIKKKWWR